MFRRISNRHLRERFFGWIRPSTNDNHAIGALKAAIKHEQKNLNGRLEAVAKYERYAKAFKKYKTIRLQAKEMAKIEREAIPHIRAHISYLQIELDEELEKLDK